MEEEPKENQDKNEGLDVPEDFIFEENNETDKLLWFIVYIDSL